MPLVLTLRDLDRLLLDNFDLKISHKELAQVGQQLINCEDLQFQSKEMQSGQGLKVYHLFEFCYGAPLDCYTLISISATIRHIQRMHPSILPSIMRKGKNRLKST